MGGGTPHLPETRLAFRTARCGLRLSCAMVAQPVPDANIPVGGQVGLVLPGGGARAAYQVGVLRGIAHLLPGEPCPFPIVVGTSAGAVAASRCHSTSSATQWAGSVLSLRM